MATPFAAMMQEAAAANAHALMDCRRVAEQESGGRWGEVAIAERARQLHADRNAAIDEEIRRDPDYLRALAEVEAELREQRRLEALDAYLASPEAERDQQEAERALREHYEDLAKAAFRVRADELGAMTPPAGRTTPTRSRERRDTAGGSSRHSGSDSSDPDLPEPDPPPLDHCDFCRKVDRSPEWGVLWSDRLGAAYCFRCYRRRTALR